MRVILLGAPGSGKGTQAEHIAGRYRIPHVSTGDLLRSEVAAGTELGIQAGEIMDAGKLMPDEIMLTMIKNRLQSDAFSHGFLLDGFPRTLSQAEGLDALLNRLGQPLDAVVFIDVDYGEIMQRLMARRRSDDTEDTIRKRLQIYEAQTAPLIDHYKAKGNLHDIQGLGAVEEVSGRIFRVLDPVQKG